MRGSHSAMLLAGTAISLFVSAPALAQDGETATDAAAAEEGQAEDAAAQPEIVVVGTRIEGARVTEALPVVVVGQDRIDAIGAVSGDELIRNIPQMGDVSFNPGNNAQTSNAARGDVGSVNLRSLGVGNTLVLLNGRRVVTHPASQGLSDTGTVPVLSYNSNAIPTTGLERLEVLLDGAAALYGSDAVAGVVNTVLKDDYDGLRLQAQYGGAEGTHLTEFQGNILAGKSFERGNITVSFEYTDRSALRAEDQDFTASANLRPLFADFPDFAGSQVPDARATRGAWPALQVPVTGGRPRRGTTNLTTAAGAFTVRPTQLGGCTLALTTDLCLVNTALATNNAFRDLRYDTAVGTTVMPSVKRYNAFANGHYDLTDNLTLFGEFGHYRSDTVRIQPPVINLNQIWIPATNYYNPFGPVGSPNRLPNLTNVPNEGLPVLLTTYRFVDTGPQTVKVSGEQIRGLLGVRGEAAGFKWDSAFVYSEASAVDSSVAVRSSALQQSLALGTPDAYNPFNGGCIDTLSFGDCTPSSQVAIDAITFDLKRRSKTTLTMGDFRASRPDLFKLPGGEVGMAFGVEVRRETQRDDRDAAVDGSSPFVDAVTGAVTISDAAAVSDNPDTYGKRTVAAAYAELAVPIVSEEMGVPLMRRFDVQLAGRYEHYSDFGSVARPKVAAAWDVFDGLRLRGSFSQGFRAPNLEQVNAVEYARLATSQDFLRCEVDLRAGRIANFNACGNNVGYSRRVSGNPDLKPEKSTNYNLGAVFEPSFLADSVGRVTFTVDYWSIRQKGIVGILGNDTAIALDYLARLNGSSNPNVVRDAANADDIAAFAGTGIAPVGRIVTVRDQFINLQPQTVRGLDFGLYWQSPKTGIGKFDLAINASRLLKFSRDPGPAVDALVAAREAGDINPATPLPETQNLIEANGRPKWRGTASLTWSLGQFQIGAFGRYTGAVDETAFVDLNGNPWRVKSQFTANLYAQVRIRDAAGLGGSMRWRVGVRNIADKKPPLTSEGYLGSLYSPYGRYWYTSVTTEF
ncbi:MULTISPECIES: TonB-dependent receptor plug domain-containing protein [unclassified Sphingopyxis]|uniref:TonB-dependent receptor plug domain-containing protein n=1 Tax=unclassified Sphingopyxis TaxID=2614943 RepID=UPI0007377081|nr:MULTISPECIES: TonB-dependent receptor [unclassified Sphingopyxis]KTE30946.1 TonB-dependent receptor [Sphingopyxis sp. HIX]KTE80716.1 TonB-dependent receptor [Sphingopyxis sp. HXXIV]